MKKILILLLGMVLLASCTQELVEPPTASTNEAPVNIDFSVKEMKFIGDNTTRSVTPSDVDEVGVADMWILQFDADGKFIRKIYNPDVKNTPFTTSLYTGNSTLVFLANIGPVLESPFTLNELNAVSKRIVTESDLFLVRNGKTYLPMNSIETYSADDNGFISNIHVNLQRMVAKVTFTYKVNPLININFDAVKIGNMANLYLSNMVYGTITNPLVNPSTVAIDNVVVGTTTTIVFYIPENLKGLASASTEKDKTGIENATYIEITGREQGTQGGTPISYCIYIGKNNTNNYDVIRDNQYTITANINGMSANDPRVKRRELPNCYVVKPGGLVRVPVVKANQTTELGVQIPDVTDGSWIPEIVWQSEPDLVTVAAGDPSMSYFKVTAGTKTGNAVVAVRRNGNIVWSWHIWVTDIDIDDPVNQDIITVGSVSNTVMKLNLGATATSGDFSKSGGLLYQWGRKDPFQGTNTLNNNNPTPVAPYKLYNGTGAVFTPPNYTATPIFIIGATKVASNDPYLYKAAVGTSPISSGNSLSYSVQYPMLYLTGWKGSTYKGIGGSQDGNSSWGGEYMQGKSPYDPCPAGWRVPSANKYSSISSMWPATYSSALSSSISSSNGATLNGGFYYAAPGKRDSNGLFNYVGQYGFYWFGTSYTSANAYISFLTTGSPSTLNNDSKDYAESVRCVKVW